MVIDLKHLDPKPTNHPPGTSQQSTINPIASSTIPVQHQMSLLNCGMPSQLVSTASILVEESSTPR